MSRTRVRKLLPVAAVLLAGCTGERVGPSPSPATPEPVATCSASGLSGDPVPRDLLSEATAQMRRDITLAAVRCDYERLEELALIDGEFNYSFGEPSVRSDGAAPAEYWRRLEAAGEEPLSILRRLLDLDFTLREEQVSDTEVARTYLWPKAFGERDPTEGDWQAVETVYAPDIVAQWREQNEYLGYRVGISAEGRWEFFVAGD